MLEVWSYKGKVTDKTKIRDSRIPYNACERALIFFFIFTVQREKDSVICGSRLCDNFIKEAK